MRFDGASAVESAGDSLWTAALAENWDIVGNTNGGYMQAIAARASSQAAEGRNPVSVTGHFTRPGHTGPVTVETEIVRMGRRYSVVRARMKQDDVIVLETLGTYVEPSDNTPPVVFSDIPPPQIAPPDKSIRVAASDDAPFPPPLMNEIDLRVEPSAAEVFAGNAPGAPLVQGWFRLKDDEPLDPFALILASDAFPPTAFMASFPVGWTPTLELTVHIRVPNPTGWLCCQIQSHFITGGYIEEDGLFWDETGQLVAQSRQLALVSTSGA